MFAFTDARDRIEVAFTDRHGGVSGGPFASLDLGEHPGLAENVDLLAAGLAGDRGGPAPVPVLIRQVHGSGVHTFGADEARRMDRGTRLARVHEEADGIVTDQAGFALVVRVADCVPVLVADVRRGLVGAAHAGRPGLVAGVVPATVATLRALGAEDLVAWVGPHVCGSCYEVPERMRAEVSAVAPDAFAETSWGTPALDIGAGVIAQLSAAGAEVVDVGGCTIEDEDLYSYRRQGTESGRQAGVVWVRP